jgi:uncharacterized membrane protein YesL
LRTKKSQGFQINEGWLEQFERWATFVLANLFWVFLSLLIVPIPFATAGLFQVMSMQVRGKQPEFFKDFFGGIRRHWRNALLVGLLDLALGAVIAVNTLVFIINDSMDPIMIVSRSVTLGMALVLLLVNLYLWSLLVVAELPLRRIIGMSYRLVVAHPLASIGILLAAALPILVSLVLPAAVFLFVPISVSAYIINWGTWRIIRRYVPEDELREYESGPAQ